MPEKARPLCAAEPRGSSAKDATDLALYARKHLRCVKHEERGRSCGTTHRPGDTSPAFAPVPECLVLWDADGEAGDVTC